MIERTIFCPSPKCRKKITLKWDRMYSHSDVQQCEKCGLRFQIHNGEIKLCYEPGLRVNPTTGEKEVA
jgi:hypothetical protein